MAAAIEALQGADNIQHADIPDYVKAAALAVASKVRAVQTSESITFIAMSDAHQLSTSADIVAGNKHAGMAAKVLAYALPSAISTVWALLPSYVTVVLPILIVSAFGFGSTAGTVGICEMIRCAAI